MPLARRLLCGMALSASCVCWLSAGSALAAPSADANDTFRGRQWYLDTIHAPEGWASSTGSLDVVVAVIDSGVDTTHPDLQENLWTNAGEIPNNGKDDDGDGYVDDVHGWNFIDKRPDVGPIGANGEDDEAWIHGTAVASLIAARGNNQYGIAGVAWRARIMPLVVLGSGGSGRDNDIIGAIRFAVAHGADIINLSLVGYEFDQGLQQAIEEATSQGVLVVSAAGNSDTVQGVDMDTTPGYPACDKGAAGRGSLTVTALTRENRLAPYANYGSCVDVSAPGADIFAARPTRRPGPDLPSAPGFAGGLTGTSVAAPLVSGLAVLLKAEHPSWTASEIAQRILETTDPVDSSNPAYVGKLGKGQINVAKALAVDASIEKRGPIFLEVSKPGLSPEIRVVTQYGDLVREFPVGDPGDRRGIRAAFVRWQGELEPDIVVTPMGDTHGAWRVYRPDGLLVAAGQLGTDVTGGARVAAVDVDRTGQDELLFTEVDGRRAWMVSPSRTQPASFIPFPHDKTTGLVALSVERPVPTFLVATLKGQPSIAIVGTEGQVLTSARLKTTVPADSRWQAKRAARSGGGSVFDFVSKDKHLVMVNEATGVTPTTKPIPVREWIQIPDGESRNPGWLYVESWPR